MKLYIIYNNECQTNRLQAAYIYVLQLNVLTHSKTRDLLFKVNIKSNNLEAYFSSIPMWLCRDLTTGIRNHDWGSWVEIRCLNFRVQNLNGVYNYIIT